MAMAGMAASHRDLRCVLHPSSSTLTLRCRVQNTSQNYKKALDLRSGAGMQRTARSCSWSRMKYMSHPMMVGDLSQAAGGGADNATVRYYIDGEETASIEFKPPLATGVGFDDLALWGTAKAGHAAKSGAWNINYRIPFQRSARVTLQHWSRTLPAPCCS